ncbi:MAG: class I SAM-dependent methyltransferase [Sulfurovaceae bacterium]
MHCILCGSTSMAWKLSNRFYHCDICDCIMKPKSSFLTKNEEKGRYDLHKNDANECGYRAFVSPVVERIKKEQSCDAKGLDFGSGRDSAVVTQLQEVGYDIKSYDPYYFPDEEVLKRRYDYISCTEVIEHFYRPQKEFQRLKDMLQEDGALYIMTEIYSEDNDFKNWYYKEDPTHVIFYTKKSFEWIKEHYGFKSLEINGRVIKLAL